MSSYQPLTRLRRPSLRLSTPARSSYARRFFSTAPPPPPNGAQASADARSRLQRLNARLPGFLQGYTKPLLGAPVTHITSFLILHEITAVVPLFVLFAEFHYFEWMPKLMTGEGGAFNEGVQRLGKWMSKKGWVKGEDVEVAAAASSTNAGGEPAQIATEQKGARLVLEFAAAYAVTKALLPVRIATSVWATPWFARVFVGPIGRGLGRFFRRKSA